MAVLSPGMARAAIWLWGGKAKAASRLGISASTLTKLERGKDVSTAIDIRMLQRYQRLTADQRYALQNGDQLTHSLSGRQQVKLRGRLKGKKFSKATRQFIRRRDRVPDTIGDIFDEIYPDRG
jgi:transcriptional regulator with XRE-family HTH domain